MANLPYENYVYENEIEDQFKSHLDLLNFVTIDNTLSTADGMKKKIRRYHATDGTEDVTQGNGNTKDIEASYEEVEYNILCSQNRSPIYDEEEMKDPMISITNARHMATDMFNHTTDKIYAEMLKAEKVVPTATLEFGAFADAMSLFPQEEEVTAGISAFVNKGDVANLKKTLGLDLKYVQDFARNGYIGSVAGVNIFVRKSVEKGVVCVNSPKAVTYFAKQGVTFETERNANTRKTTAYSRKYYVPALTDAKYAVKILVGMKAVKTTDSTVQTGKTYYTEAPDGNGYIKVANPTNEKVREYFEIKAI